MGADLLETFQILTQLVVQLVGQHLAEATILDVLLTIQEPVRDLVLAGIAHDSDDALHLSQGTIIRIRQQIKTQNKTTPPLIVI